ncbi:DUF3427 domain-containing protein [Natronogracilivirga saccharolytica]|uniref:DUF3427 domain-containing protein n=1 Tax=Natronogracilivirga saccharolytica TaxID=2812953 RepID=A0A8J7UUC1_9BACT|nr:DEAD/DEAH box helicase [Natronogracilivirga saccharolytica]MBP3193476.1 DUF3427 domain-containing protein [Natronogracilivirga saccharolytica]
MTLTYGLYEQLISRTLQRKLEEQDQRQYHIAKEPLDPEEAALYLSRYLSRIMQSVLGEYRSDHEGIKQQIQLCNELIERLNQSTRRLDLSEDLIEAGGQVLTAVFDQNNAPFSNLEEHLKRITPVTRLTQSELFTGSRAGITMESELKKEILSSDRIDLLISFIKWTGIRIFEQELREFTGRGGRLRVITTSYLGATDEKAIRFLNELQNTEIRVSYNTGSERLHAKSYLFRRNTGFHTAYIGSSNISQSALTSGLEWNLKVTNSEISHIIDKFIKTFETYWNDYDFEPYEAKRLTSALRDARRSYDATPSFVYFDLRPYPFQQRILETLSARRSVHDSWRNLIVAATGTGKTVISGFDYRRFCKKEEEEQENLQRQANTTTRPKLLFIAHREEILKQAMATFRGILRDQNFGELWTGRYEPTHVDYVFASVQTLNSRWDQISLSKEYYDYIVVDEVHHIAASSYRPIIDYFKPKVLLGLTATPERMDGEDILRDFDNRIAAEIRLPEALNRKLLCPFQYFGITDSVDLSGVTWRRGGYATEELSHVYTASDARVGEVIDSIRKYTVDEHKVRALGFCVDMRHAEFMAERFVSAGFRAAVLTSKNAIRREELRLKLARGDINYLFVVDMFNEGLDIPEVDTVLFLRPTESLTVFLQQLGRGLRNSDGKECLTVLDYVANARKEYDYEHKFRALVGKTDTSTRREIERDFPNLPLGCSITLERVARDRIIENIRRNTRRTHAHMRHLIRQFQHQSTLPLTLENFLEFYHLDPEEIYKRDKNFHRLCADAGLIPGFSESLEKNVTKAIFQKWLPNRCVGYFRFIRQLLAKFAQNKVSSLDDSDFKEPEHALMAMMLCYDIWSVPPAKAGFSSLTRAVEHIGSHPVMCTEIVQVLDWIIARIEVEEKTFRPGYPCPLRFHARYHRDQILTAFGFNDFRKSKSIKEGVARIGETNTELLFVTLEKSEKEYSPTTMYHDYAINEELFHWQSQNSARPDRGRGQEYVQQRDKGKNVLLFVRERKKSKWGNTIGYVFLGPVQYVTHEGAQPMSITWRLEEPMPASLLESGRKLVAG